MKKIDSPVIILGAKQVGKRVYAALEGAGVTVYGFLEDDPALKGGEVMGLAVLGPTTERKMLALFKEGEALPFVALEEEKSRQRAVLQLKELGSSNWINAVAQQTHLPSHLRMGEGNLIEAGVIIGAEVVISSHSRIGSGVCLGANSVVHDFVHIGAGSTIGAEVCLEEGVHIGYGVVIEDGVKIGAGAQIPSGMVVQKDVLPNRILPSPFQSEFF